MHIYTEGEALPGGQVPTYSFRHTDRPQLGICGFPHSLSSSSCSADLCGLGGIAGVPGRFRLAGCVLLTDIGWPSGGPCVLSYLHVAVQIRAGWEALLIRQPDLKESRRVADALRALVKSRLQGASTQAAVLAKRTIERDNDMFVMLKVSAWVGNGMSVMLKVMAWEGLPPQPGLCTHAAVLAEHVLKLDHGVVLMLRLGA